MQDSRINYVIVGAFVAAMVTAFIVAMTILAGGRGASDTYFTVYDNVTDIKYGTGVMYEGYPIGQVDDVKPSPGTGPGTGKPLMFKVTLKVDKAFKIPEDSLARAAAAGLLSAMVIDIRGGQSATMIAPGGEIPGVSSSNFFATLSDLSKEFGTLSNDSIRPLLQSLNSLVRRVDSAAEKNLPGILKDLEALTNTLAKESPAIAASVRRTMEVLEKDLLKPENVKHLEAVLANVDETTGNLAKFSADLDEVRKSITEASTTLNKVVQDNAGNLDETVRDLRYTMGTAARYIDEIAQNAAAMTRNMSDFSRTVRDNPSLLLMGGGQADDAKTAKKK